MPLLTDGQFLPALGNFPDRSRKHLPRAPQELQVELFLYLALNAKVDGPLTLNTIDDYMKHEKTFYACRAVRRLLLGVIRLPVLLPAELTDLASRNSGWSCTGHCLVLRENGFHVIDNVTTDQYLTCVMSRETTDPVAWSCPRGIYFTWLGVKQIDYTLMFRFISRYVTFVEFEECYVAFIRTLEPKLQSVCEANYFTLLGHLRSVPRTGQLPRETSKERVDFIRFNVCSFVSCWGNHPALNDLKERVLKSIGNVERVKMLAKTPATSAVSVSSPLVTGFVGILNQVLALPAIMKYKRDPGSILNLVNILADGSCKQWLAFPSTLPIYRIVFCMLFPENGAVIFETPKPERRDECIPRLLVSMFTRMDTIPKDNMLSFSEDYSHVLENPPMTKTNPLNFALMNYVSINGYKVTIFNTNMVINTKIRTRICRSSRYRSILDIPRLTNNFVNRKFSVKEPAFTTSIFYSANMCEGVAININISGDQLQFMFAMGILKCIVPILAIYPVSVANWNSTMDLHGLENQSLVRSGRKDVFWTTNFPSVISTKAGFNVSWFKAATANISRIHGSDLYTQVHSEVKPIIGAREAKIDRIKNRMFTRLENRNGGQVTVLHKMFLECLYEVVSFKRLNCVALGSLVDSGLLDFSKRIVCHSKNKHECSLIGYRKSDMIPKILIKNRKARLDRLGRNANFLSLIGHIGRCDVATKHAMVRHIGRRFGLWWRKKIAVSAICAVDT